MSERVTFGYVTQLAREAILMLAVGTPRHPGVIKLRYCALLASQAPHGSAVESSSRFARRGEFVVLTEWCVDRRVNTPGEGKPRFW